MKTILLLATISFCITSCSSEYSERLAKARALKLEIIKTLNNRQELGVIAWKEVADLQNEIEFHAKVSGNQELFIDQLENE